MHLPIGTVARRATAVTFLALLSGGLAACGQNSSTRPDGSEIGSFELSYGGGASGTVSGFAVFFNPDPSTGNMFAVVGRDPDDPSEADTGFDLGRIGPLAEPGTYELTAFEDHPEDIFGLEILVESNGMSVQATGGTVTFTQVKPDLVQGTFEASLTGHMDGNQNITVTATGSFEAVSCEEHVENCPPEI